jgi:hypothetical protein
MKSASARLILGDVVTVPLSDHNCVAGLVVGSWLTESPVFYLLIQAAVHDCERLRAGRIPLAGFADASLLVLTFDTAVELGRWVIVDHVPVNPNDYPLPAHQTSVAGVPQVEDYSGTRLRPSLVTGPTSALRRRTIRTPASVELLLRRFLLEGEEEAGRALAVPEVPHQSRTIFGPIG